MCSCVYAACVACWPPAAFVQLFLVAALFLSLGARLIDGPTNFSLFYGRHELLEFVTVSEIMAFAY